MELPAKANGHLDVGTAVGKDGVLTVIRDNRLQKEPTVGQVRWCPARSLRSLTSYYAYSEQVPTVMALGVLVDKDLSISLRRWFYVQLLPALPMLKSTSWKRTSAHASVTELLHAGKTPEDMMQLALAGFTPNVLDERTVQYQAIAAPSAPRKCCSALAVPNLCGCGTRTSTVRWCATSATASTSTT